MTREFIITLAIFAASYCYEHQCVGCQAVINCSKAFGRMRPDIEDWEQFIMQKLDEEPYKDDYGDSDGRRV